MLLKQPNSLPLTKMEGGGKGGRREGKEGGRERVYVCLRFVCITGKTSLIKFVGMHVIYS